MKEGKMREKIYDLEERTFRFVKRVIAFVNRLSKSIPNIEIGRQLVRSAGSVGANYLEANESLGKKDFVMHIRICRKEAKESRYWLRLAQVKKTEDIEEQVQLVQEATEFTKIFGSIVIKKTQK
jgi:four helix bundle protein